MITPSHAPRLIFCVTFLRCDRLVCIFCVTFLRFDRLVILRFDRLVIFSCIFCVALSIPLALIYALEFCFDLSFRIPLALIYAHLQRTAEVGTAELVVRAIRRFGESAKAPIVGKLSVDKRVHTLIRRFGESAKAPIVGKLRYLEQKQGAADLKAKGLQITVVPDLLSMCTHKQKRQSAVKRRAAAKQ